MKGTNTRRATKEKAYEAFGMLIALTEAMDNDFKLKHSGKLIVLKEFITAAAMRLPTEAAVQRARIKKLK